MFEIRSKALHRNFMKIEVLIPNPKPSNNIPKPKNIIFYFHY